MLGETVVPVLPPRHPEGELKPVTLRLPEGMWADLKELGERQGYSQNETVIHLLRWALAEAKKELGQNKPTSKR